MKIDHALESYFKKEFNQNFTVVAGRANIVLYSFYKTLPPNSKIVFPAVMCPSPLLVAKYAGMIPVLCDVDAKTGLICAETLKKCLDIHPEVKAVLSVNLFGQRPNNKELSKLCKPKNITLIEDGAQGWSPFTLGQDVNLTVLSFGSKKPLDSNGGGIGITNDKELIDRMYKIGQEIQYTSEEKINSISALYGQMYYMLQSWEKVTPGAQKAFVQFTQPLKELYFKSMEGVSILAILRELENHRSNFAKRHELAQKYHLFFSKQPLFTNFMTFDSEIGPWRYGVLYNGKNRDKLLTNLREHKVDVSSWYPSLENLGFERAGVDLTNSKNFGDSIINLWVSDITDESFDKCLNVIEKFKE
jgi:dTDP-4-amino-4,6-dideoxygalactose transaminase